MSVFTAIDKAVEISGITVLSYLNAMDFGRDIRERLLNNQGIYPNTDSWHSQQAYLDVLRITKDLMGKQSLFLIGRAIPDYADFPTDIQDIATALYGIERAYHINHRCGEIGYYQVRELDEISGRAVMECRNPYPSELDRGIITTMARRYTPSKPHAVDVVLDTTQPSREQGADFCWYIITW